MATLKPLIDYLPQYMQEYDEIKRIMATDQVELEEVWDAVLRVWANQFLFSADEYGISRLEAMFEITAKSTDTLEERRFRIFALTNQELPYTWNKLKETLTTLCGEDYSMVLDENNYSLDIKLGLSNRNNLETAEGILHKMVPANMVITISILYNQHSTLADFTHAQLHPYTHDQLRNEVIS